jgi:hypothetical protein
VNGKIQRLRRNPTRISHTFSGQIAALPIEIASQVGEDSVHATRPRPLERQDHRAGCASCQRKCEKSRLVVSLSKASRFLYHHRAHRAKPVTAGLAECYRLRISAQAIYSVYSVSSVVQIQPQRFAGGNC